MYQYHLTVKGIKSVIFFLLKIGSIHLILRGIDTSKISRVKGWTSDGTTQSSQT